MFEVTGVRQYDWEQVYGAEEYIGLLSTFSGHLTMADWQRDRLFGEVRRILGQRRNPSVRRHWGTVLHVARRREGQARLESGRALDLVQELGVGAGLVGLVQQQLEGLLRFEGAERAAQLDGRGVLVGGHQ